MKKNIIIILFVLSLSSISKGASDVPPLEAKAIRADLLPVVRTLVELGPYRWVKLSTQASGRYQFQRGLSGGVDEALLLLSGIPYPETFNPTVSYLPIPGFSDHIAHRINSGYSNPLTVRGRTDEFAECIYYERLTPTFVENLQDPQFDINMQDSPHLRNQVGNRRGETQRLCSGLTIDSISDIGIFPTIIDYNSITWAKAYIAFYGFVVNVGSAPLSDDSRGTAFHRQVCDALAMEQNDDELRITLKKIYHAFQGDE